MKTTHAKLKTTQNHQLENRKNLFAIFSSPNVLKSEANGFHCCQIHNFAIITKRSSPAVDAVPECGSHFAKCSSACSVDSTVWNVVFMWCVRVCCVACRSDQSSQITVHSLVWADRSAFCIVAEMSNTQQCNTQHILAESFRASRHPWLSSASVHSLWPTPLSAFFQTYFVHGSAAQYKVYNAI